MTAKTTARDHLRVCGADGALAPASHGDAGSPPRVRSRQHRGATHPRPQRITSACAEQTSWPRWSWRCARDHLRVCGADFRGGWPVHLRGGSPPRVRSRPDYASLADQRPGITSACAEQTSTSTTPSFQVWDHLRVCGADHATPLGDGYYEGITSACAEQTTTPRCGSDAVWDHLRVCGADPMLARLTPLASGSPPRVRSRHPDDVPDVQQVGITSACAEQTLATMDELSEGGDHLRVCGADREPEDYRGEHPGSPPRVRSRPRHLQALRVARGITSACAEQTGTPAGTCGRREDHLRVCGADAFDDEIPHRRRGSPPRVRSRRRQPHQPGRPAGITSACAEQTGSFGSRPMSIRDHLRVCGADPTRTRARSPPSGSPPRVRSRQRPERLVGDLRGITSACAEQTRSR